MMERDVDMLPAPIHRKRITEADLRQDIRRKNRRIEELLKEVQCLQNVIEYKTQLLDHRGKVIDKQKDALSDAEVRADNAEEAAYNWENTCTGANAQIAVLEAELKSFTELPY